MTFSHTDHSYDRCSQRNFSADDIDYIIRHGRVEHRAGTKAYFLGKRDVPRQDRRDQRASQLVGALVMGREEGGVFVVITAYRNRERGLKAHRKKAKYDRR